MSVAALLFVLGVMTVAGTLQGAVGFGANLVAAPLLSLVDPTLVPGPVIAANLVLNLLVLRRERRPAVWAEVAWPIAGQVPGTVAGVVVLTMIATRNLTVLVAAMTLVAVAISAAGLHPRRTNATLLAAGVVSGFVGAASGIGGPPIALMFQHATGPEIRGAISRFFLVSGCWSVVVLAAFGRFDLASLGRGALLVPGVLVGYRLSGPLLRHVDRRMVRRAVLVLSTLSACVALVHNLG